MFNVLGVVCYGVIVKFWNFCDVLVGKVFFIGLNVKRKKNDIYFELDFLILIRLLCRCKFFL